MRAPLPPLSQLHFSFTWSGNHHWLSEQRRGGPGDKLITWVKKRLPHYSAQRVGIERGKDVERECVKIQTSVPVESTEFFLLWSFSFVGKDEVQLLIRRKSFIVNKKGMSTGIKQMMEIKWKLWHSPAISAWASTRGSFRNALPAPPAPRTPSPEVERQAGLSPRPPAWRWHRSGATGRATRVTLPVKKKKRTCGAVLESLSATERRQRRVSGTSSLPLNVPGPCSPSLPRCVYLGRRHVDNSREDWCQRKEGDCSPCDDFNYYNYWTIIQQHHRSAFCLGRNAGGTSHEAPRTRIFSPGSRAFQRCCDAQVRHDALGPQQVWKPARAGVPKAAFEGRAF